MVQSAEAVKYTDSISVEGLDSPNVCPEYDTVEFWLVNACNIK